MREVFKVYAFNDQDKGGNPAGVCIETVGLTDEDMQEIASKVGFSETAFVFPSQKADFLVRFFTPTDEVDLCGHATIATFNVLRDKGILSIGEYKQETKAGILKVKVYKEHVLMEQSSPKFLTKLEIEDLESCFEGLHLMIDKRYPIQICSTGMKEIFLPLKDLKSLYYLNPNYDNIVKVSKKYDVIGIHVFTTDSQNQHDGAGRNFAPLLGISEESATGTSNGALAAYFYKYITKKETYTFEQGYSMGLPSLIDTSLKEDGSNVWVGGTIREYR